MGVFSVFFYVCSLCVFVSLFVCVLPTSPCMVKNATVKMVTVLLQIHVFALTSYETQIELISQSCNVCVCLWCPRSLELWFLLACTFLGSCEWFGQIHEGMFLFHVLVSLSHVSIPVDLEEFL